MINALSELEHPCQAMADMLTLQEQFGDLHNVHLAYVGDGNNVAHSLMLAAASLGASISVANAEGLRAECGDCRGCGADLAHADRDRRSMVTQRRAWRRFPAPTPSTPMYGPAWGRKRKRPNAAADFRAVPGEPASCSRTPPSMPCSCTACRRIAETKLTASVIDSPRSVVFDQAENRLHIQKAILVLLLEGGVAPLPAEECTCVRKSYLLIPEDSTPPSSFRG